MIERQETRVQAEERAARAKVCEKIQTGHSFPKMVIGRPRTTDRGAGWGPTGRAAAGLPPY